jgi:hypothetical protein
MRAVPYDLDTEASFEIAESILGRVDYDINPPRLFRDPAAVRALEKLAAALRDEGYNIDIPRPGKACPAVCSCLLAPDPLQCFLSTFYTQSFIYRLLRRDLLASPQFLEVWRNLCGAIDKGLRQSLAARSVKWDRLRPC